MDKAHSTRPDGSPAAREPWAGRRPEDEPPSDDPPRAGPEEDIPFDERLRRAEEDLRREREAAAEGSGASASPSGAGAPPRPGGGVDFAALFVLLDALRSAVPAELQGRVTALVREALLTLRSLIDWYLDRLDRPEPEQQVEDIPIE